MTIYPVSAGQAVDLASQLHEATAGLAGPRIASDRRLKPGSLVHYRYGRFRADAAAGSSQPTYLRGNLLDGNGRLFHDRRGFDYAGPPDGMSDPFETAGIVELPLPRPGPLASRFLVMGVLARSAVGGVYAALDLADTPPSKCVVKEYWEWAGGDEYGHHAPEGGFYEANLLMRHSVEASLPKVIVHFQIEGNLYVVLSYVDGLSLESTYRSNRSIVTASELLEFCKVSARPLAAVHAAGIIFRDFTPSNLVLTPDGEAKLVDFGSAFDGRAGAGRPSARGTFGYCSPQQWRGEEPSYFDDIYSWGAVAYSFSVGDKWKPGDPATEVKVQRPPLFELAPWLPNSLCRIIERALAPERSARYSSVLEILHELDRVEISDPQHAKALAHNKVSRVAEGRQLAADEALSAACNVGDRLLAMGTWQDAGICWTSHIDGTSFISPDLYHGTAGVALFLTELVATTESTRFVEAARAAIRWLAGPAWYAARQETGLYAGEAGVGFAFLRASRALGEPGYVNLAVLHWNRARGRHQRAWDIADGDAGLLLFLCQLSAATRAPRHYQEAREAADRLMSTLVDLISDEGRGRPLALGFAHGVAGVGLSLLRYSQLSTLRPPLNLAIQIADLLVSFSSARADGGYVWPLDTSGRQGIQAQCHGAIGIGQFLSRIYEVTKVTAYLEGANGAARFAARHWEDLDDIGLCHGLAGYGSLLFDCERITNSGTFGVTARRVASRMAEMVETGNAGSRPDFMAGLAGAGWFLLRAASADGGSDALFDAPSHSRGV